MSVLEVIGDMVWKDEDAASAPVPPPCPGAVPSSRAEYEARLRTFALPLWCDKPGALAPPSCAARGWSCAAADTLACATCSARLVCRFSPRLDAGGRGRLAARFAEELRSGHAKSCPWRTNSAPASFARVDETPAAARHGFGRRSEALRAADLGGVRLDPDAASEVRGEAGVAQASFEDEVAILAACGWEPFDGGLSCAACGRTVVGDAPPDSRKRKRARTLPAGGEGEEEEEEEAASGGTSGFRVIVTPPPRAARGKGGESNRKRRRAGGGDDAGEREEGERLFEFLDRSPPSSSSASSSVPAQRQAGSQAQAGALPPRQQPLFDPLSAHRSFCQWPRAWRSCVRAVCGEKSSDGGSVERARAVLTAVRQSILALGR